MKLINAPEKLEIEGKSVFLAGSIEMGAAINWQIYVIEKLKNKDVTILNPRRLDWDSSWVQSIENKNFREQVEWELSAMQKAKYIIIFFDPGTKSPITLLELGLYAKSKKLMVCCPEGYWRKGNVDVVCEKYRVPHVDSLELLVKSVEELL